MSIENILKDLYLMGITCHDFKYVAGKELYIFNNDLFGFSDIELGRIGMDYQKLSDNTIKIEVKNA